MVVTKKETKNRIKRVSRRLLLFSWQCGKNKKKKSVVEWLKEEMKKRKRERERERGKKDG